LVSSSDLPVDEESLPLHIAGLGKPATEHAMARLLTERPDLQARYGGWVASLHPAAWKEVEAMARATKQRLTFDIRPAIKALGWNEVIAQVGLDRVIEQVGLDRVIEQVGLDRVIEQVGLDRVIEQVGEKEVIKRIGIDRFVAALSPTERRQLKQRLG
jgi:hypothetical protein